MKKKFLQLSLAALSLVFLAAVTHAYIAPTAAPGADNTDAPLDVSALNQAKSGGLTVGTFQAQQDAYFDQTVLFDGLLRGGTATNATAPINFGGSANKVDVNFSGAVSIDGIYQSDTLKNSASAPEPVCGDTNGTIFLCGTTPSSPVSGQTIDLFAVNDVLPAGNFAVAKITQSTDKNITVTIDIAANEPVNGGPVSMIKNFYTANAIEAGVCDISTHPITLGTVVILAGTTNSYNSFGEGGALGYPGGCNPSNSTLSVGSYSPTVDSEGRDIVAEYK
jgi:hypothetical protein